MDARYWFGTCAQAFRLGILFFAAAGIAQQAMAQRGHRTRNFIIQAPTQELAVSVGEAAERYRRELADYWLGRELPPWPNPCPVRVVTGPSLPAQGVTTYQVSPVRDFQMEVVGSPTRILDSVLPHEVTHTILATHFGRPLPRWADEGVCTTVEHSAEKTKHEAKLREFLTSNRGIPMNKLFLLKEYPQDVLPMYAQGYSVCQFLIAQQGPREFIQFLEAYMQRSNWTATVQEYYGYESLAELQTYWLEWLKDGGKSIEPFVKRSVAPGASSLAANATAEASPESTDRSDLAGRLASAQASQQGRVAPASAVASADGEGWYLRRRQEAASRVATDDDSQSMQDRIAGPTSRSAPSPARASSPLSAGHSAAQPQPEQQMGSNPWPLPTGVRSDSPQPWAQSASTKWR